MLVWWSTKEWDGAYGMCGFKGTISPQCQPIGNNWVFRIVKRKGTQKYSVTHIQFNIALLALPLLPPSFIFIVETNFLLLLLCMLSCIQTFWVLVKGNRNKVNKNISAHVVQANYGTRTVKSGVLDPTNTKGGTMNVRLDDAQVGLRPVTINLLSCNGKRCQFLKE